jgi:hypothetical protein
MTPIKELYIHTALKSTTMTAHVGSDSLSADLRMFCYGKAVVSTFEQAKSDFLTAIEADDHLFSSTLEFIAEWFDFTPSAFMNGHVANSVDQNQGSCKVFALAQQLGLSQEQALRCFGEHYRDVLATPQVDNHHNLRRVLHEGLDNITFDQFPLTLKS